MHTSISWPQSPVYSWNRFFQKQSCSELMSSQKDRRLICNLFNFEVSLICSLWLVMNYRFSLSHLIVNWLRLWLLISQIKTFLDDKGTILLHIMDKMLHPKSADESIIRIRSSRNKVPISVFKVDVLYKSESMTSESLPFQPGKEDSSQHAGSICKGINISLPGKKALIMHYKLPAVFFKGITS